MHCVMGPQQLTFPPTRRDLSVTTYHFGGPFSPTALTVSTSTVMMVTSCTLER